MMFSIQKKTTTSITSQSPDNSMALVHLPPISPEVCVYRYYIHVIYAYTLQCLYALHTVCILLCFALGHRGVAVQKRLVRRIRGCEAGESPREARKKNVPLFFLTVESAPVAFVQSCITINSSPAALRVLWRFVGST